MVNRKNKVSYQIISEQTNWVSSADITILQESKTESGEPKAIFKCKLQTGDELNQNKRRYSMDVCRSIVEQLKEKALTRSLLCEVDHPMPQSSDPNVIKRRAATVEAKTCGALIRSIELIGKDVIAEVETLSGFYGPDLAKMLLYDKVNIGFSLRALGAVEPQRDGSLLVTQPIKAITYDVVTNPSHANARVLEFLPESDSSLFDLSSQLICESEDILTLNEDHITICENGVCSMRFINDVITESFEDAFKRVSFRLL